MHRIFTVQLYKNTISRTSRGHSRYGQTTHKDSQEADKPVLPALDKILTLGRTNKLLLLSLNRIFRGEIEGVGNILPHG